MAEIVMMLPFSHVSVPPAFLNIFLLLLVANFHLLWAQGRGEGIPEVIPFLPQKQETSFKGCFASLPSKALNAPLFFSCSPACKKSFPLFFFFVPICQELLAKNWTAPTGKKKNQGCDLMYTGFFQKGQFVHSSSFTSHSCPLSQVCCSWTERGKLSHFKTPLF